MGKRYMDKWQALLSGNADEVAVERAYRFSFTLAAAGCAMVTIALVGLVLL